MKVYKTLNTNEDIPSELFIFQLYDHTPLGRIYEENFKCTKKISSAGINNLFYKDYKEEFLNGNIEYVNIFDKNFSTRLSKFGYENLNNDFEIEIEKYRKLNYKKYPSRLTSIYAFGDYETCKLVSQIYKWNLNEVKKFKIVQFHSACKVHMEIISVLKSNFQFISNLNEYYEKYWYGDKIDEFDLNGNRMSIAPIYEYLIEGVLEEI